MKTPKVLTFAIIVTLMMSVATAASTSAASNSTTSSLNYRGTSAFATSAPATASRQSKPSNLSQFVNRSLSRSHNVTATLNPPVVKSTPVDSTQPALTGSFRGLQATDNGNTNGFDLEPPDQGLCAGNGYLVETINDVIRVYKTSGAPATPAVSLNAFYNYPPLLGTPYGPELTDPSCYYDQNTQNWYVAVLTLDTDPNTGGFTGSNHIDLAISKTMDPTGAYNLYSFSTTDDGTNGTPSHPGCPCIGDYPHIGADKYGFFVTTNEYSFFGPNYNGSQVYAMSKRALAQGFPSVALYHFQNLTLTGAGTPAFTLWPTVSPPGSYAINNSGTEYFLSSIATSESNNTTGFDNRLGVWAMVNTQSLAGGGGQPNLISTTINSEVYGIPPASNQKPGLVPLAQCLNNTACATKYLGGTDPYHETEGPLDSNDSRMQQTTYIGGLIYGALDTVVNVNGATKAGIAYFVVRPQVNTSGTGFTSATVVHQGYLATAANNVNYPALAVMADGRDVMTFTLVGRDYYPSMGYVLFDAKNGKADTIHVAAAGAAPQDGFTEYQYFGASGTPGVPRPRWGDYGAAVVDGMNVYAAGEYIAASCSAHTFFNDPTCGGTRDFFANFSTRISSFMP